MKYEFTDHSVTCIQTYKKTHFITLGMILTLSGVLVFYITLLFIHRQNQHIIDVYEILITGSSIFVAGLFLLILGVQYIAKIYEIDSNRLITKIRDSQKVIEEVSLSSFEGITKNITYGVIKGEKTYFNISYTFVRPKNKIKLPMELEMDDVDRFDQFIQSNLKLPVRIIEKKMRTNA